MKTACFTGHRPNKFKGAYDENHPQTIAIKSRLKKEVEILIEHGVNTFISGGALGVDSWAAEIVIELKQQNPNISLIIAKPFPSQDRMWPEESKIRFKKFCDAADQVIDVSEDPYEPAKMMLRNSWMVDRSDYVIAVWDGSNGGTGNCVKYAKRQNKQIILIEPSNV